MKPTPRPWRIDLTYPKWPMILGADGTKVNVDFENVADAALIVAAVNSYAGPEIGDTPIEEPREEHEYVEWWGVPVRMP